MIFSRTLALSLLFFLPSIGLAQRSTLRFVTASRPPNSRVQAGAILTVVAKIANEGDAMAEGTVVASVQGTTSEQSARKIYVPPKTERQFDVFIQMPSSLEGLSSIEVDLTIEVTDGGRRVMLDNNGTPASYSMVFTVDKFPTLAGLALDEEPNQFPDWYWPQDNLYDSYELAVATRIDSGNTRQTANYDFRPLPLSQADYSAMDVVVISEEKTLYDASVIESLKNHLTVGGRVWIMLDRIDSSLIRQLYGSGQSCETIDEIQLNDFTVEVAATNSPLSEADRSHSVVNSIGFKRVIQTGGRISHSVDGWPAAIWMKVGYGDLLLTTLSSEAWIQPRTEQVSHDQRYHSSYTAQLWASEFAGQVNEKRSSRPLTTSVDYPLRLIGNPVVPRSWVTIALSSFCLLVLSCGVWRFVAGDLSWLGVIAPALSIGVSCLLIVSSSWVRRGIPESVSRFQIVEVSDDGRSAITREQAAVHLDASRSMTLISSVDGQAAASNTVSTGIRRFEVDDFHSWGLSNQNWPPGPWRYNSDYILPTDSMFVTANLTNNGVEMQLPAGLPSRMQDAVLRYAPGNAVLCTDDGENLVADSVAASGERWITGSIISDEQQRRLEIYQEYFRPTERSNTLSKTLYGWTEVWPQGPAWDSDLEQKGSALVALPVRLRRPPVGTTVKVPHSLIKLQRNSSDASQTFAYNDVTGEWVDELTVGANARLQFVLPTQTVPIKTGTIELTLDIKAPHRNVRILAETDTGPVELANLESPSLPWRSTIGEASVLESANDGILDIVLEVSERTDVASASTTTNVVAWQVNYFHASISGEITALPSLQ